MALIRPSLNNITTYPANTNKDFSFNYTGSQQAVKNNLVIQKISDNTEVYNKTIDSFLFQHTVNANTLINGIKYKARIRIADINNNWSDFSDWVVFNVNSYPNLNIATIINGKINNQNATFTATYFQTENDNLVAYRYLLYDKNKNLQQSFSEKFDGLLQQEIAGFENNEVYHVELKTLSQNNMEYSTGLIQFRAEYIQPKLSAVLELENFYEEASIKVNAKVIQIIGQVLSGKISYVDDDWVSLKNGSIYFQEGFNSDSNFSLKLWLKDITPNVTFFKDVGRQGYIELKFIDGKIHLYKVVNNNPVVYHIWTKETINPTSLETVFIGVQQIDNFCNVTCKII